MLIPDVQAQLHTTPKCHQGAGLILCLPPVLVSLFTLGAGFSATLVLIVVLVLLFETVCTSDLQRPSDFASFKAISWLSAPYGVNIVTGILMVPKGTGKRALSIDTRTPRISGITMTSVPLNLRPPTSTAFVLQTLSPVIPSTKLVAHAEISSGTTLSIETRLMEEVPRRELVRAAKSAAFGARFTLISRGWPSPVMV